MHSRNWKATDGLFVQLNEKKGLSEMNVIAIFVIMLILFIVVVLLKFKQYNSDKNLKSGIVHSKTDVNAGMGATEYNVVIDGDEYEVINKNVYKNLIEGQRVHFKYKTKGRKKKKRNVIYLVKRDNGQLIL